VKNKGNRCCVFVFILGMPILGFCQNTGSANIGGNITVRGRIVEQDAATPLPYVNIGILNKPVGTVSDSSGHYELSLGKENLGDSLQISLVGYVTRKILANDLMNGSDKTIALKRGNFVLGEFVVRDKKGETESVGRTGSGKFIQISIFQKGSTTLPTGSEMGMKFRNRKKGSLLRNFHYCLSMNNFKRIKFRVNIYSLKNNMPDTLIYNPGIFTEVKDAKTGWNDVDLSPYHISVDGDFVLTLQWIESELGKKEDPKTSLPVSLSVFSKNLYYRIASQDKWGRMGANLSAYVTLLH